MRHHYLTACLALFCLLEPVVPVHAADSSLLTPEEKSRLIALIKSDDSAKSAFNKLQEEADSALHRDPKPIQTIQTQGQLAGSKAKVATATALKDMDALYALGYVYAVTGEAKYADKTRKIVLAWADINKPTGDPIDETNLESLFVAYDLTRSTFSDPERNAADAYLRKIIAEEWGAPQKTSNWQSHRLKVIGLAAYALNDQAEIDKAIDGFKQQIALNLEPDGSSFDFHERDALHYHVYDLEPLLALAIAAQKHGLNLYDFTAGNHASVHKSIDFLIPYCTGEKEHAEYVNSKVEFDRKRAANGQKDYKIGHPFEPEEGYMALCLASHFDPTLNQVLSKISSKKNLMQTNWILVLNAASRSQ